MGKGMFSVYTRCFGLLEVFIEVNGVCSGWGIERGDDGVVVTASNWQLTASTTRLGRFGVRLCVVGLAVNAALTLSGLGHFRPSCEPLELFAWLVMVKKYTV